MRQPSQPNPALEALLDERDHLKIQISIAVEAGTGDPEAVKELIARLAQIESEIAGHWKGPHSAGA